MADRVDERGPGPGAGDQPVPRAPRLDLLKALGDNTRYAIYLELARSPLPLTTGEIAEILDLHVNTVRPHLERMREVGLLAVDTEARGGVGRPQHRYQLAADAPSLGVEPSPFPTLARMLLAAAAAAGLERDDMVQAGRVQGRDDAAHWPRDTEALDALIVEQARLGFDPTVVEDDRGAVMAFAHCPFRQLAERHPDLVCGLHCGLVEGLVGSFGDARVTRFATLVDRNPCQAELVTR
ncbi:MAG: helix-turn-helix domain-containing protein [Acidimicrobiales bacterium]|jgi:predicted ArsR family transcriptional regulator|nr:helix-turn-helix domain-containing protein [Acidimicrobiales bacterium]